MRRLYMLGATALIALSFESPAFAQLDEIVVQARKRDESLRDIPVSGTAITPDYAETLVLDGFEDYLRQIPGSILVAGGPAYLSDISFRGQGGGRIGFSESSTGVYRNGLYNAGGGFGGRTFNRMDLFDFASFEAYRGPQGALYGRNAVGGAVNITTQKPTDEFEGRVKVGYRNVERLDFEGVANIPVNDDLALRFGAFRYDQDGGHIDNLTTGNTVDTREYLGLRAQARANLLAETEINLTLEYYDAREPAFATLGRNLVLDPSAFTRAGLSQEEPVNIQEKTIYLEVSHPLDIGTFEFIGAFKDRRGSRLNEDLDHFLGGTLAGLDFRAGQAEHYDRYGAEARLVSPDDQRLRWLVGADFQLTDEFVETQNFTITPFMGMTIFADNEFEEELFSVSGFGAVNYDLTDVLTVDVELRVQHDQKDAEFLNNVTATLVELSQDTTALTPVVSLTWDVTPDHSVYGRLASGYRPGGFNQNGINAGTALGDYDEEQAWSFETGWKGALFDRRVQFEYAGFYVVTKDVQAVTTDPALSTATSPGAVILQNAGDNWIIGAEFEMRSSFNLGPGMLQTNLGVGTTYGEWKDGASVLTDTDGVASTAEVLDLEGVRVNRTRDYTLNLSTTYIYPIPNTDLRFTSTASFQAEGGGYENVSGDAPGVPGGRSLDNFDFLDLRFALANDSWRASVFVNNLYDEIYRVQTVNGNEYYNQPRTFGGEFTLNF